MEYQLVVLLVSSNQPQRVGTKDEGWSDPARIISFSIKMLTLAAEQLAGVFV